MKIQVSVPKDALDIRNKRLYIDDDSWLDDGEFSIVEISDDEDEVLVEVEESPLCRFFGWKSGMPPACHAGGGRWYMEGLRVNDPAIVCLHCRLYSGWFEKGDPGRQEIVVDGYAEVWPFLRPEEAAEGIAYISMQEVNP